MLLRTIEIDLTVQVGCGKNGQDSLTPLLQVRLCLDTQEFVRANIMSKKINTKVFKDTEIEDLKLRFYTMIVRYHTDSHNWMEIFRAYQVRSC